MSERASRLSRTAGRQITDLIEVLATCGEAALRLPCPSREKLGDGTVAASAEHTTRNYQRIGAFVTTTRHGPDSLGHGGSYTAENTNPADLVEQLSAARADLACIAELTDRQLDGVPPRDSFRFCDGQRTLEQVLSGLLRHQDHQVRALKAALSRTQ